MPSMRFPVNLARRRFHDEEAYTEEQIIRPSSRTKLGLRLMVYAETLASRQTLFYNWRSKFAGLEVNEAKRLRELETENNKL